MKSASAIEATILNAVITNTKTKIVMGGLEPDDALYMARVLFLGFIDYTEYKPGTGRPVANGHEKVIAHGNSEAEHEAVHEMRADSVMRARAHAHGVSIAESFGTGSATATGDSAGQVLSPPMQLLGPSAPNASMLQYPLSESQGRFSSRSDFEQSGSSQTTSEVTIESEGEGHTVAHGQSRGLSRAASATEAFVTKYEWMPSQLYSAAEQLDRLIGEVINLGFRECYIKVGNCRPIRTRTADLAAPFRSEYAKQQFVPAFLQALARSPYLRPVSEVDVLIQGGAAELAQPIAEHNFTAPEPMPVLDQPEQFAADFWRARKLPKPDDEPPKPRPKKPRGRRPLGDLKPAHDRFRVVDGDKDG